MKVGRGKTPHGSACFLLNERALEMLKLRAAHFEDRRAKLRVFLPVREDQDRER